MAADEGNMERHEISTEKIDWPELVRHVACERIIVELFEGQRPIAMLVPIERRKTMAELDAALRVLPRLGADDATKFEADIQEVRASMSELDDPWES
jgi:antitoxin (DNA-binding transcriptional repressor) of toxin-antitoxin stability system